MATTKQAPEARTAPKRIRRIDDPQIRVTRRRSSAARFDRDRVERLALWVGALVVVLSLFLPWYAGSRGGIEIPDLSTGWEWLGVLDVYLLAVAIAACALLFAAQRSTRGLAVVVAVAAALGLLAVLYRLLNPADDLFGQFVIQVDRGVGPFVCLLGTGAVAFGAISRAAR